MNPLKANRLLSRMTKSDAARLIGVTDTEYSSWEEGAKIPKAKIKSICLILHCTENEILGIHEDVGFYSGDNDIRYFGEIVINFSGDQHLIAPISETERVIFANSIIAGNDKFIKLTTLDNRTIYIRRKAVQEVYFSSEAYDSYGPDTYDYSSSMIINKDFWSQIEYADCESIDINETTSASAKKANEMIEDLKANNADLFEALIEYSSSVRWKITNGPLRIQECQNNLEIANALSLLENDTGDDFIKLPHDDDYHRLVLINTRSLDYISVPTHKYKDGLIEAIANEMGEQ